jgi:CcmD family protein
MKKIISLLIFSLSTLVISAQDVSMADTMRSEGKIMVVIAVMLTILLGIVLYLIRLERKISKLEKNN